jgi:hypothetical protein
VTESQSRLKRMSLCLHLVMISSRMVCIISLSCGLMHFLNDFSMYLLSDSGNDCVTLMKLIWLEMSDTKFRFLGSNVNIRPASEMLPEAIAYLNMCLFSGVKWFKIKSSRNTLRSKAPWLCDNKAFSAFSYWRISLSW